MLIYLVGPDAYRRGKKLAEIMGAFREKHPGSEPERFSMEDLGATEKLRAFISSQSLFGGPKLAVLTDLADAPAEAAELMKSQRETKDTTLVIVSDKKLASPFTFLAKPPVLSQSFESLGAAELGAFIKSEAAAGGVKISPADAGVLAASFKGDTWGIVTEIEKMALGAGIAVEASAPAFFTLIQTLRSPDVGSRLGAVSRLIEREEPAAAFNIAAAVMGPGFKNKMADYDILVKSGKLEYEEALLDFAIAP